MSCSLVDAGCGEFDYPLTAPAVRPRIRYYCNNTNTENTGMLASTDDDSKSFHWTESIVALNIEATPTGRAY